MAEVIGQALQVHGAGEQARTAEVARSLQAAEIIDELSGAKSARRVTEREAIAKTEAKQASELEVQRERGRAARQRESDIADDKRLTRQFEQRDKELTQRLRASSDELTRRLEAAEKKASDTAKAKAGADATKRAARDYSQTVKMFDDLYADVMGFEDGPPEDALITLADRARQIDEMYDVLKARGIDVPERPAVSVPITIDPAGLLNKRVVSIPLDALAGVVKLRNAGKSEDDVYKWLVDNGFLTAGD